MKLFHKFYYSLEYLRMRDSHIRKDFSIESYTLRIESMDKSRVVHTEWAYRIINTNIPKATKISLFCFATNIGISTCLHDCIFCTRINVSVHSAVSLSKGKYILMSFVGHHTTFYASHREGGLGFDYFLEREGFLSSVRERKTTFKFVCYRNNFSVFITTFSFCRFILKKVTFCSFIEDKLSCSSNFYTFLCARVGLEFHRRWS